MLHKLDTLITVLEPITLVVFLSAWVFGLVSVIRKKRRHLFVALAVGGVFIVNIMTLAGILTIRVRHELIRFVDESNGPFTVQVFDRWAHGAEADSLLGVVRSTRRMSAHHSHTVGGVRVQITDAHGCVVHLVLARDSSRPREYWVYQNDYRTTSLNEVGRVVTPLFDRVAFGK